ncbi:MAG: TlpA family protein disulfide reductase [Rhodospirillales bacterium]|nr:MAG: TlpA family protein disulfide reductase [Rhodospirillales bacterium]
MNREVFSARRARSVSYVLGIAAAIAVGTICAAPAADPIAGPPLLGEAGMAGYREYLEGDDHRAFAIAPGGAWAWVSDMPDPGVAESEAIRACSGFTDHRCLVYAVDGQVVLDERTLAGAWTPYLSAGAAATRPAGTRRTMRFPDLRVTDPAGRPLSLSDLHGRIVFLHFWGSWCPPCQVEFPELQRLYDTLKADDRIAFVLVQSREDIERSRLWASRRDITLPLFDSGARGPSDHVFHLSDGDRIEDRLVAPLFPATYVLDRHGIIMFSHFGPLPQWPEYARFLRHAAEHTPR